MARGDGNFKIELKPVVGSKRKTQIGSQATSINETASKFRVNEARRRKYLRKVASVYSRIGLRKVKAISLSIRACEPL